MRQENEFVVRGNVWPLISGDPCEFHLLWVENMRGGGVLDCVIVGRAQGVAMCIIVLSDELTDSIIPFYSILFYSIEGKPADGFPD